MKAAVIQQPGSPPVFQDRDEPQPGADHALVEVAAAAITPLDVLCASGTSYWGRPAVPYVPGVQGAGTVHSGSGRFAAGQRVWFSTKAGMLPGDGSMAQLAAVAESALVAVPDGVDERTAAGLGFSAVAAWRSLLRRAQLQPGERVVVLGAGGVVGQVAIQLARISGAGRIVAAARSAAARERAQQLGADAVVDLSRSDDAAVLQAMLAEAVDGLADVAIDPLCGPATTAALRTLGPYGRLVQLGSAAHATAEIDSASLRSRTLSILGYTNAALTDAEIAEALGAVFEHAAAGRLTVAYEATAMSDVAQAWQRQLDGTDGRRVIVLPQH